MRRSAVIGGGLSGLGAALILRRLGREVVLVEKSSRLAPLVRGFRRDGLHYETAFHYAGGLGKGQILYRYLDSLGLFEAGLKAKPLIGSGGEILRFSDGDVDIPGNYEAFRKFLPESKKIDGFLGPLFSTFEKSLFLNPEVKTLDAGDSYLKGPSLAEALDALDLDGHWRNILGFRCLLYGVRPTEARFSEFALVNVPYLEGGGGFEGGGAALAQAFENRARSAGVTILGGREVTAIRTDSANKVRALEFRDSGGRPEELEIDLCVYSGSPSALPGLLPEIALRPVLARRLLSPRETPSAFMLFGHSGSAWLSGRQLFICPDGDLDDWFEPGRKLMYLSGGPGSLENDQPQPDRDAGASLSSHRFFAQAESRPGRWPISVVSLLPKDATSAWAGFSPSSRPRSYLDFKERHAEELRRHILSSCPELNGDFEVAESATDLSFESYSFNFGRGIYGTLHGRDEPPILPLTRVGGLALAGQNIVMPGLLGVLVSSALAVSCLVGLEPVLEVIHG